MALCYVTDEDLDQETALLFLQHPHWPRDERFRLVVRKNLARNMYRKHRRMVPGGLGGDRAGDHQPGTAHLLSLRITQAALPGGPDPAAIAERRELQAEIQRQIRRLSDMERQVLHMRYYQDFKPQQIANLTGIPVNTIYETIRTAKNQLKRTLDTTDHSGSHLNFDN